MPPPGTGVRARFGSAKTTSCSSERSCSFATSGACGILRGSRDALEQLADERDAVGATPFVTGTEAATVETMPPLGSITPKVPIDLEAMAASWTNRVQALIKSVRGE